VAAGGYRSEGCSAQNADSGAAWLWSARPNGASFWRDADAMFCRSSARASRIWRLLQHLADEPMVVKGIDHAGGTDDRLLLLQAIRLVA
jgi:hypothetical protein